MNPNLKEFLLKTGYAVVGLVISSLVVFLHTNPDIFGASTAIIVGICSVVEALYFPSVVPTATPVVPPQA